MAAEVPNALGPFTEEELAQKTPEELRTIIRNLQSRNEFLDIYNRLTTRRMENYRDTHDDMATLLEAYRDQYYEAMNLLSEARELNARIMETLYERGYPVPQFEPSPVPWEDDEADGLAGTLQNIRINGEEEEGHNNGDAGSGPTENGWMPYGNGH